MSQDKEEHSSGIDEEDIEDTDFVFDEKEGQTETDVALDKELEGTFPTSDPPSSWAGPDIEPERPESEASSRTP